MPSLSRLFAAIVWLMATYATGPTTYPGPIAGYRLPVTNDPSQLSADRLLGQPDCAGSAPNNPAPPVSGLGPRSLNYPYAAAIDPASGRLYVADTGNHRVLSWPSAAGFRTAQPADLVLGQPDFTTHTVLVTPTAASLNNPIGLALDPAGNLYVADQGNHRVIVFDAPAATDLVADRVYGQQGSFTSATPNSGGLGPASLSAPRGVAIAPGWVVIADTGNHRVLAYPGFDLTATLVFGQPDFTTDADVPASALSLFEPGAVALGGSPARLYVADTGNHRLLAYANPFGGDPAADQVFGQADFAGGGPNRGPDRFTDLDPAADTLWSPSGLVLDAQGSLLVADSDNYRVLVYENAAALGQGPAASAVFGQHGSFTTNALRPAAADTLNWTNGVAVDGAGNVYVADSGHHRLLAFDVSPNTGCHLLHLPAVLR
jgi:DNA-binding beta-propeller fold protein YncE